MRRLVGLASLKIRAAARRVARLRVGRYLAYVTLLVFVCLMSASVTILLVVPGFEWLPQHDEARTLFAALLTAQAAIAALTLAVTQFVIQGVSTRRDANDRMYREYVQQSWVRQIFWGSIVAVVVGGVVFMAQEFVGGVENVANKVPGLKNLTLLSVISFGISLALPVVLFEKALFLLLPERWSTIRRTVNERGVRQAIEVYLSRHHRVVASLEANEPNLSATFPDPEEGLADEAIRGLLGDARRAMSEHGLREFTRSLNSIKDLISYAMDEIESHGTSWSAPGGQPDWPPVRDLRRNLYSFREDVIRAGNREYIFELLGLDYWLLSTGARRSCGELFTTGLESYRTNYQISVRVADREVREILRDRAWTNAPWTITRGELEDAFPYAIELVRHQERMLSDALHLEHSGDFEALHNRFETSLRLIRWDWDRRDGRNVSDALTQFYRVVLMGVGGRAIILAESGRLGDPCRYLTVCRGILGRVEHLAGDIAQALRREDQSQASQWSEWEWEGAEPGIVQRMSAERYPLTFFAVRLMELSSDAMPVIDLQGTANEVLSWFESNADRLLSFVSDQPDATREHRREWAAGALRAAVKRDEIAEDDRVIASELSPERVAGFNSSVYETALAVGSVERLFRECGAFLSLTEHTDPSPEKRGFFDLVSKAFLADMPSSGRTWYEPLKGDQFGRGLVSDILARFCEALDEAPELSVPLNSPEELLSAFDDAKAELGNSSELVAVLAGDWMAIEVALHTGKRDGFIPAWQLPDGNRDREWGQYHGHTLLRGPRDGERRLYLVDPRSWGCFVRAQCEGDQDLSIEIKPISADRAQELLDENPNHIPDESDQESKLRKLQTFVELAVCHRIEFRVKAHSRAKRMVSAGENVASEVTEAQPTSD